MLRIFRCSVQNLTRKKECRSQEKKSNHLIASASQKEADFLLTEKEISTIKDRMCKVWMTVFSTAAGIFSRSNVTAGLFK